MIDWDDGILPRRDALTGADSDDDDENDDIVPPEACGALALVDATQPVGRTVRPSRWTVEIPCPQRRKIADGHLAASRMRGRKGGSHQAFQVEGGCTSCSSACLGPTPCLWCTQG